MSTAAAAAAAAAGRSAGKLAQIRFDGSLRSQLCHLPIDLHAPLVDRKIAPQNILIELTRQDDAPPTQGGAPHKRLVLGWTGFSSAPSSPFSPSSSSSGSTSMPTIAIAPTIASLYTPPLTEGTLIRITLLRSPPLPTASRINLIPLTPDHWEILSAHAQQVEDDMLAQVRGAAAGMHLTAHVGNGGRTVCRFLVEATEPKTLHIVMGQSSASSSSSNASSSTDAGEKLFRAVRLTTNTEVVIAPKVRANGASSSSKTSKPQASTADDGKSLNSTNAPTAAASSSRPRASSSASISTLRPNGAQVHAQDDDDEAASQPDSLHHHDDDDSEADEHPHLAGIDDLLDKCMSHIQGTLRARQLRRIQARQRHLLHSGSSSSSSGWLQSGSCGMLLTGGAGAGKTAVCRELAYRLGAPSPALGLGGGAFSNPAPPRSALDASGVGDGGPAATAVAQSASTGRVATKWIDCTAFAEERLTTLRARMAAWLTDAASLTLPRSSSKSSSSSTDGASSHPLRDRHSASSSTSAGGGGGAAAAATLLILDNLDRLLPAPSEHTAGDASATRILTLAECFAQQCNEVQAQFDVFVLATAQGQASLHPCVSAGVGTNRVFGEVVQVKPPGKEARKEILAHLIQTKTESQSPASVSLNGIHDSDVGGSHSHDSSDPTAVDPSSSSIHPRKRTLLATSPDLNPTTLATQTDGFFPADLKDLVERAVHQAAMRVGDALGRSGARNNNNKKAQPQQLELTMADFAAAQDGFVPLSLRDVKLEKSTTAWSDIGGLHATRQTLRETLEWPTKYAAIFASCPLRLRSGLLLYGFPGCGKTLLASAVARECGLNFISVKGPEILNKYIGASEKSVRDLFDRAQAARPCVLFFDEFDSIAPKRGHDSTGVTDRVVNQLLTQMDGAEGLEGVYVLAATSRPDLIDSALLRPGRLDKSLLCDMPGEDDRVDILRAISGQGGGKEAKIQLAEEVELREWARRTEGFSGADLQALLYNAHLETIHESISDAQQVHGGGGGVGASSGAKDDGPPLRFVSLKSKRAGGAGADKDKAVLSGAEQQALRRRLELIVASSTSPNSPKTQTSSIATSAAATTTKPKPRVTNAHLERSLASTRPSVPPEEQLRLRKIYRAFAGEREGTFPDGEASREIGARESLM
ncbi:hypothetical protein V8E36_008239 [Tilletia maclaganii]